MKPILFSSDETAYTSNGLGRLSDSISCTVVEELNGAYELELQYPAEGIHASDVEEGLQILATHDESGDRQPFRIYCKTDTIDGVFTVLARHISGDLSRIPVMPFTASSARNALQKLTQKCAVDCPFSFHTDITATGSFVLDIPISAKAALGSGGGSILGVFGGEVKYDRRRVSLLARRGVDTNIIIRYGKNITGFEVASEASSAYNAVVPYCKTQEGTIVCNPPVVSHGDYVDAVPLDLSSSFEYVPLPTQLRDEALAWLEKHQPWITERAINVSFVRLRQTDEYDNYSQIENVLLGDGITIKYSALDIDARFRVIKTDYDVLRDSYNELTLGREIQTVSSMINTMEQKIDESKNAIQEIANGTYVGGTFLNGQLIYSPEIYGGEISIGENGSGYNFSVDHDGNIITAGNMTAVGHYAVKRENGNTSGYMGRAKGYDGEDETYGVALCAADTTPDTLDDTNDCYMIVTTAGVRMQSKGNSLWVGSGGAYWDGDLIATQEYADNAARDAYRDACRYADSLLGQINGGQG